MHVSIMVIVTQGRKIFEKKILFLVIEKTHLLFVFMQASLALWLGMEENERRENSEEKEKRKTEQSGIPSLFPPKCLQFGMEASLVGPKKESKQQATSREKQDSSPKANHHRQATFFLLSGFSAKATLALHVFCGRDKLCSG